VYSIFIITFKVSSIGWAANKIFFFHFVLKMFGLVASPFLHGCCCCRFWWLWFIGWDSPNEKLYRKRTSHISLLFLSSLLMTNYVLLRIQKEIISILSLASSKYPQFLCLFCGWLCTAGYLQTFSWAWLELCCTYMKMIKKLSIIFILVNISSCCDEKKKLLSACLKSIGLSCGLVIFKVCY